MVAAVPRGAARAFFWSSFRAAMASKELPARCVRGLSDAATAEAIDGETAAAHNCVHHACVKSARKAAL